MNCNSMKIKKRYNIPYSIIDTTYDIKLTSDHRYLIMLKTGQIYIIDLKFNMVIYRSSLFRGHRFQLKSNFSKIDRFSQNLIIFQTISNNFYIGYLSLKYLNIFQQKSIGTQTLKKRYFKTEDLSLYNRKLKKVKHSQEELNDHLKIVFKNLGFDTDDFGMGE